MAAYPKIELGLHICLGQLEDHANVLWIGL